MTKRDVHTTHCCPVHGCKYRQDHECPVQGGAKPTYPNNNGCELCQYDQEQREFYSAEAVAALEEIHDYQCGCEHPGDYRLCVARPTSAFAILRKETNG